MEIGGKRDLAGAPSVHSAAFEAERVGLTDDEAVRGTIEIVDTGAEFAGEVATVSGERRVVETLRTVRHGRGHLHVGGDGGQEGEDRGQHDEDCLLRHVCVVCCVVSWL